jgi:protocatechuate 3,4-dioxygenase, beta subunit
VPIFKQLYFLSKKTPSKPAQLPANIHISIKEPNIPNEYCIDEFVFDNDKLLNVEKRKTLENRGGSGILSVQNSDGLQIA